jgi:copper oxidase (laccase) domain-containing protein
MAIDTLNQSRQNVTPQEIQFAVDSPEYVEIHRIPILKNIIERPSSIDEIARTYQKNAGPLGFLEDDQIQQLKSAGYLVGKINNGDFPNHPWLDSDALSDFGLHSIYTNKVLVDDENDFNVRPTDLEGDVNRMVLYERLGIEPDQVLSPVLSSGRDVVVVQSGDELEYDKNLKRLKPLTNNGKADGWIIKGKVADYLGSVGAVADCPMVTLTFINPEKEGMDAVEATGMMHMGWPNIGNGIDLEMAEMIKKEGLEGLEIYASVSPGARFGLELPKDVIRQKSKGRADFGDVYASDILTLGKTTDKGEKVDIDTVKLSAQLLVKTLGIKPENVYVSDRCTISDTNSHSHRREKGKREDRPEAGRFAALTLPIYASRDQYFRDELFGDTARGQVGLLSVVSDEPEKTVYRIN